ncbi:hypothetical protein BAUCODRAFT_32446 [Baudoinia panamericana UAMH 10762]|uniref:Uncharacterized protein n=1 Tax=Baudoinia panamericana (strain UAMH 10762) TaxID=717646 RepID=M2NGG4_BAUPA|nr:uncharacterized protein BAUCODRAFT_32446 [Baudoinia panamericana UAMH 10762]EMC98404.1 hypothetical protein BAUCODRAFT_32446 [Baudoinia panamericana UAMH 10762]
MPLGEVLDDDYVINLLKQDAEGNKKRYVTSGLGSLLSNKPRDRDAPRPNTRFLHNIVKEADRHNAALKAREEEDARERLRQLKRQAGRGKRAREADGHAEGVSKRSKGGEREGRWAAILGGLGKQSDRQVSKEERPHARQSRRSNAAVRMPEAQEVGVRKRKRSDDELDRGLAVRSRPGLATEQKKSRPKAHSEQCDRRVDRTRRSDIPRIGAKESRRSISEDDRDSDPLDDVIGPRRASASRARGRGAASASSSAMDAHFDPSYDPKSDVSLDRDEADDWDMALEALRDRAKWRTQGADRLKAAGFTDDEAKRWEKGGERDAEDVRWRKKGEDREWDRGKVLDVDGDVRTEADWAA